MIARWKVLKSRPVATCRIFDVRLDQCVHPQDGRTGDFFVLEVGDWVNVMAVTPDDRFVLVRQYRHGTRDFTLEVPGGMVDEGESPLEAAKREGGEAYAAQKARRSAIVSIDESEGVDEVSGYHERSSRKGE